MGKFQNSVWLLKRKQFREYAKQNHEWVDPDSEQQFDEAVNDLKRKRDFQYVDKIKERYGDELLYKVIDWGRSNLSQLEMDSFKNFEEMNAEYVMQNKDSLSADEIGKFFDKKSGKLKAIVQGPDDYELGEIEIDDDGNVSEKPPTPRMKIQPKIPDSTISKDIGNHKKKLSPCFVVAAFLLLI